MGDVDQFVISGHAFGFGIEAAAFMAFDLHLVQLEIAERADYTINLA